MDRKNLFRINATKGKSTDRIIVVLRNLNDAYTAVDYYKLAVQIDQNPINFQQIIKFTFKDEFHYMSKAFEVIEESKIDDIKQHITSKLEQVYEGDVKFSYIEEKH